MLVALSVFASFVAGLARAPWWFWLVSGITLALLAATDPRRLRASYSDMRGLSTLPMLFQDAILIARECAIAAGAFGLGAALSSLIPV